MPVTRRGWYRRASDVAGAQLIGPHPIFSRPCRALATTSGRRLVVRIHAKPGKASPPNWGYTSQ
jgi:hypothetical protein